MTNNSLETIKDCHYPWTWMMVTADGKVMPCCFASKELGNLNEATADAIWNGITAQELRSYVKQNRVHPVCSGAACKFVQNTLVVPVGESQDSSAPPYNLGTAQ